MPQSLFESSIASLSPPEGLKSYTPAVTAHYVTPETASHTPVEVGKYETVDGCSILIRKGGAGISVETHVTGLPGKELGIPAPTVGSFLAYGTTFSLFPDGTDARYHISIKELPACIQTKDGQSTIYTLRNKTLHSEGSYPVRGPLLTQSTYIDPTLCVSHTSEIMVSPSLSSAPSQSSPANDQGSDGHITNGHAIDGQTSNGKRTNVQSTNNGDTTGTAVKASIAYKARPGRRLASHRRD